jgi:superfamily II DNA or RNA helicase
VQVASIDTLRNRPKPPAEVVIIDEAHRALAKSYRDLAAHYVDAVQLGLTATPYRADGKGLGSAYQELVVVASPRQLIGEGYLVAPHVFTVPQEALPDLAGVPIKGGDYDESQLAAAVDRTHLVGNIVEHWRKHAGGIRTVAFAVSVAHSKHIVARFQEAGVAAEHLDGTTPGSERDAILARLDSGATQVVSNCGVLCEGWDQPAVKCAILARPTKSTGLYLQQAGRILRPWQNTQAIILDHAGCAHEHGLPDDDREFSLEGRPKRSRGGGGSAVAAVRTCGSCYAVVSALTRVCPSCGNELVGNPEERDGALVEMNAGDFDERRSEWSRLCTIAAARRFDAGWVYHRYKERFGVAPPASFPKPSGKATELGKRAVYDGLRTEEESAGWAAARYHLELGEPAPEGWR